MGKDTESIHELDRIIHEPARLSIMALLNAVELADFVYLLRETKLTRGNLSAHMSKLEDAGYVLIERIFAGKIPRTTYRLTAQGIKALQEYKRMLQSFLHKLP